MIRGQKVYLPELEKMYTKLGRIVTVGKHSKNEDLYLRNAMNSLDTCIKSKQRCGNRKNEKK
jgi:hypothetical protein